MFVTIQYLYAHLICTTVEYVYTLLFHLNKMNVLNHYVNEALIFYLFRGCYIVSSYMYDWEYHVLRIA